MGVSLLVEAENPRLRRVASALETAGPMEGE